MENNTSAKKQLPAFVILGIIALVAALVLAVTNAVTKGPIAEHAIAALREAFSVVMPADEYEEITVAPSYDVRSLYAARTGGEIVGYCVTAAGKGYNGDVAVTLGVGTDGLVTGAVVGDTSFAETPNFGARAKEPAFQEQFAGLDAVNGGSFDALSGATITSTAVLNAVNRALICVDEMALNQAPAVEPLVAFGAPAERPAAEELTGEVLEATGKGFASDVLVQITLDESGAVSGINIDSSGETEGFGQRLMTELEFGEQFIGQTGPFKLGENIDVLAGASVTSGAVVEAVNSLLAAPTSAGVAELPVTSLVANDDADLGVRADGAAVIAPVEGYTGELSLVLNVKDGQVTAAEFAQPAGAADAEETGDVLTGSKMGFEGQVTATITLNEDGTIATLEVSALDETPGLGKETEKEEFTSQFIGKAAPFTLGENVDGVSGATITSKAVIELINELLVVEEASEETAEPLTGSKMGFEGQVTATITLNEDGTIATLEVSAPDETPGLGKETEKEEFTSQFIGKAAPFTLGENVDGVSGATITSKAVVELINELLGE